MTASSFEYFGQTTAAAAPPLPVQAAAYVPPTAARTAARPASTLLGYSLALLTFAGTLIAVGQLLRLTPAGNVMADDPSGLGVGIIGAGLVAAMLVTALLATLAGKVR
jgi:hypothetical protein